MLQLHKNIPDDSETEPDKDGIITRTEYMINERNNLVKVTTRFKKHSYVSRIYNSAIERRRNWTKFGLATGDDNVTFISPDEVFMEDPRIKSIDNKPVVKSDNITCRICLESHWTMLCPLKDDSINNVDNVEKIETINKKLEAKVEEPREPRDKWGNIIKPIDPNTVKKAIRVTNLAPEISEYELYKIFSIYGKILNISIAKHKNTQLSRGFGYILFDTREIAEKVMDKLQNYRCCNVIIKLDWCDTENL